MSLNFIRVFYPMHGVYLIGSIEAETAKYANVENGKVFKSKEAYEKIKLLSNTQCIDQKVYNIKPSQQ